MGSGNERIQTQQKHLYCRNNGIWFMLAIIIRRMPCVLLATSESLSSWSKTVYHQSKPAIEMNITYPSTSLNAIWWSINSYAFVVYLTWNSSESREVRDGYGWMLSLTPSIHRQPCVAVRHSIRTFPHTLHHRSKTQCDRDHSTRKRRLEQTLEAMV